MTPDINDDAEPRIPSGFAIGRWEHAELDAYYAEVVWIGQDL